MSDVDWQVITGDCLEVMPTLAGLDIAAVITDPPYGMRWNAKVTTGPNGHGKRGQKYSNYGKTIANDDKPFDPSPFLDYPIVVLWGYNHYAPRLQKGTTLIWIKKHDRNFGKFLSDAEVGWMKGGEGVYCFRDTSLLGETKQRCHTNQKPVELMKWVLDKAKVPPGALVFDPYCGSGTTGVACIQTGRCFIGIEIDEGYAAIARQRIEKAASQARQMELI